MTVQLLKNVAALPSKPDVKNAIAQYAECKKLLQHGYKFEAAHEYSDKDGAPLFYRVRLKNPGTKEKWIRPVHFNGTGWVWKEPEFEGDKKPPYNIKAITSDPKATIWICEGEWAADHLNEFFHKKMQGLNIATTSGACSSAGNADWDIFANRKVIIWPDNDSPGFDYAKAVADKLISLKCHVEMVNVKKLNLPESGDAVDWLKANPNAGLEKFESIEKIPPIFEEPAEPLFDIGETSVAGFLKTPPPPRKYLLEQCLPIGKTGLLVGMGGVRKSQFMLQMQIAIATGKPLCGNWPIGERGNTLGLYAEEDTEELHRRLYCAVAEVSKEEKKLIEKRVHIKSMSGIDNQMVSKEDFSGVVITDFVYRLIVTANQIPNLKLIILDPASRFRGGDENSSIDTTRFVEACEIVAKGTGATILIVHHVNKASMNASEQSQAASRGSSALTDGVRWQMNMSVMSTAEAKAFDVQEKHRKTYVKAEVTKNNYAPPQEGAVWLELTFPHGILKRVEMTMAADNKSADKITKIVNKVAEEATKGKEYSKSGFAKEYGGAGGIFEIGDKGLRGLVEQAIEEGLLVLKAPKNQKINVVEVLVVADKIKEPELHGSTEDFANHL